MWKDKVFRFGAGPLKGASGVVLNCLGGRVLFKVKKGGTFLKKWIKSSEFGTWEIKQYKV